MKRYIIWGVSCLLLPLLIACSDNNNNNSPGPTPPIEPEVPDLNATGHYSGTVETTAGDVSLMSVVLARTGEAAISFETDDSEKASIVLWGSASGDDSQVDFEGVDTDTQSSAGITLDIAGSVVSGQLSLDTLEGSFSLEKTSYSDRESSLESVAGTYLRNDNASGLTTLVIANDGGVQLSGSCEASGTVSVVDAQVNIYSIKLSSDCIELDALLSLQDSELANDTLVITGAGGDRSVSMALYRS